jgi:hypothetical protein
MEISQPSDRGDIDFGVLRDLLYVAFPKTSFNANEVLGGGVTYVSNSAFMLEPMARE